MKVPLNLTKDQVFIAVTLGVITGFYNWKTLLIEHLKEETEQINELYHDKYFVHSLAKKSSNVLVQKFSAIGLLMISGALAYVCFKVYIGPQYTRWRYRKMEEHANIIYELRYGKASQEYQDKDQT